MAVCRLEKYRGDSPFFINTTPANDSSLPASAGSSKSHKYTELTPPSKYISRYVSNAELRDDSI